MKLPTRLVQRAKRPWLMSIPDLPIYETTTFVFDSAAQVQEYNEGRAGGISTPVTGIPRSSPWNKRWPRRGADAALLLSSGQAAITTALLTLLSAATRWCAAPPLRRHVAPADRGLASSACGAVRAGGGVRPAEQLLSDRTRVVWFESPINPTLRWQRHCPVAALPGAQRASVIGQHVRQSGQPAAARARRRPGHAQRDQYLNGHTDVTPCADGGAAMIDRIEKVRRGVAGR